MKQDSLSRHTASLSYTPVTIFFILAGFFSSLFAGNQTTAFDHFITHKHITRLYKKYIKKQAALQNPLGLTERPLGLVEELRALQKEITQQAASSSSLTSVAGTTSSTPQQNNVSLPVIDDAIKEHCCRMINTLEAAFAEIFASYDAVIQQSPQVKENTRTTIQSVLLTSPDYFNLAENLGFPSIKDVTLAQLDHILKNESIAHDSKSIFGTTAVIRELTSAGSKYFSKKDILRALCDGVVSFFSPSGIANLLQRSPAKLAFYFVLRYDSQANTLTIKRCFFGDYQAIESDDEKEIVEPENNSDETSDSDTSGISAWFSNLSIFKSSTSTESTQQITPAPNNPASSSTSASSSVNSSPSSSPSSSPTSSAISSTPSSVNHEPNKAQPTQPTTPTPNNPASSSTSASSSVNSSPSSSPTSSAISSTPSSVNHEPNKAQPTQPTTPAPTSSASASTPGSSSVNSSSSSSLGSSSISSPTSSVSHEPSKKSSESTHQATPAPISSVSSSTSASSSPNSSSTNSPSSSVISSSENSVVSSTPSSVNPESSKNQSGLPITPTPTSSVSSSTEESSSSSNNETKDSEKPKEKKTGFLGLFS